MAVDTRDKRFSILGLHQPVPSLMPNPDGGFTEAGDREMLLFLYLGLDVGINIFKTKRPLVGVGI